MRRPLHEMHARVLGRADTYRPVLKAQVMGRGSVRETNAVKRAAKELQTFRCQLESHSCQTAAVASDVALKPFSQTCWQLLR
jgi:hypothetical protein